MKDVTFSCISYIWLIAMFAILSALQIFQKERHPSVYKVGTGNSGAKEGLSLFGKLISNILLCIYHCSKIHLVFGVYLHYTYFC